MGSSCSCNNFNEYQEDLININDRKPYMDFFLDYSNDTPNPNKNIESNEIIFKEINSKSLSSNNNNDLGIFSTNSYTNNFNNLPIFRNNSYGTLSKEIILEEDKDNEREIIVEKEKNKENDLYIDDFEKKEKEVLIDIDKEKEKCYNTQIKLIPKKKKILFNDSICNYNSKSNSQTQRKTENLKKNSSYIKQKLIYSCSSEIIVKNQSYNDIITEEEYNASPDDNYSLYIFQNINGLRTNPKKMIKIIEENKKYIFIGENNEIFFKKNKIRFNLNKGYQTFDETINILNNIEPMNRLIYNKNITIKAPDNEDSINNFDYLRDQVEELQNNGNHISSFWSEKIKDPEICFLMMVIDDNYIETGLKRKDLLNPDIKYIGILSVQINNQFTCYITLSNRK